MHSVLKKYKRSHTVISSEINSIQKLIAHFWEIKISIETQNLA